MSGRCLFKLVANLILKYAYKGIQRHDLQTVMIMKLSKCQIWKLEPEYQKGGIQIKINT